MCICVYVFQEGVDSFNLWGQLTFLDITNEVMIDLKSAECRQRIML